MFNEHTALATGAFPRSPLWAESVRCRRPFRGQRGFSGLHFHGPIAEVLRRLKFRTLLSYTLDVAKYTRTFVWRLLTVFRGYIIATLFACFVWLTYAYLK